MNKVPPDALGVCAGFSKIKHFCLKQGLRRLKQGVVDPVFSSERNVFQLSQLEAQVVHVESGGFEE